METNEDVLYTFTEADFRFFEVDPGDTMEQIQIKAATGGTLWVDFDGNGLINGTEIEAIDDDVIKVADIPNLSYLPALDGFGTELESFQFKVHDGEVYSEIFYTLSITVISVNDSPTSADNSVSTQEDTLYIFHQADFPYADVEDHDFFKLEVQPVGSGKGTLWVDTLSDSVLGEGETEISGSQEILIADIPLLKYMPPAEENGHDFDGDEDFTYTSFQFRVHDSFAFSGDDKPDHNGEYTLTIEVVPVNDKPLAADGLVTASEDIVFTFKEADFNYNDPDDYPGDLAKVRLQEVSKGTLWFDTDGNSQINGSEVPVADNDEVDVGDLPKLKFLADEHDNGAAYATFEFEVHDTEDYSVAKYTMTIDVTAVNDAPVSDDNTVTSIEDTVFTFASTDFPYTDVEIDPMSKIRITPSNVVGTLWVDADNSGALDNGEVAIAQDDEVDTADISKLKYLASLNVNGDGTASFRFRPFDGELYSVLEKTITINVIPVNDAPTSIEANVTATEDTVFAFSDADFPYADVESTPMAYIWFGQVSTGQLWLDTHDNGIMDGTETAIAHNQVIQVADLSMLRYLAPQDANDITLADSLPTFNFEVHDGELYAVEPSAMTINVTPVNDAPLSENAVINAMEDVPYVIKVEDFPLTDVDGDELAQVRIQPASTGTFWLDLDDSGVLDGLESRIGLNQVVSVSNFPFLKFVTDHNDNGPAYATFLFEIHDGQTYSPSRYVMTIDVEPVNDNPINSTPGIQSFVEDGSVTFSSANGNAISVSDPEEPGATGKLFVTLDSEGGMLDLPTTDGLAFSAGANQTNGMMSFSGTPNNINNSLDGLVYKPAANQNGTVVLTITTTDRGGDNLGTNALSDIDSIQMDIAAVNDTPILTLPANLEVVEDNDIVFNAANGNAFTITDDAIESDSAILTEIRATQGSLILASTEGLEFTKGSNGESWLIFSGSLANISTALEGMIYRPLPGFSGNVRILASVDDKGATGAGSAFKVSGMLNIVAPLPQRPTGNPLAGRSG